MTETRMTNTPEDRFAGSIHLVRHGEPDLSIRGWLTRADFNAWWARYAQVDLVATSVPTQALRQVTSKAATLVASPIPRALATARAVAEERTVLVDEIFEEAPLPAPFIFPFFKTSPLIWGIVARFIWWLGYSGGGESRYQAEVRVREAVDRLIELAADGGGDVVLFGHGWFNHMAARELKRRGWFRTKGGGTTFWDYKSFASPI